VRAPSFAGMRRTIIAMTALLGSLAAVAPAAAGTLALEGDTDVYTAAPGLSDLVHVRGDDSRPNEILIKHDSDPIDATGTDCYRLEFDQPNAIRCAPRGGVRAALGDGNDFGHVTDPLPAGYRVTVDGGPGDDQLNAPIGGSSVTFLGGDGNDTLKGQTGHDVLDGGAGRDTIDGDWTQRDRRDNDTIDAAAW
jgi:Ca2+-binding RTX toxin-like protein